MNPRLLTLPRTLTALAGALLLLSSLAAAQRQAYSYISYVGSDVALISSADDDSTARVNTPVLAGDRIETPQTSRAEIVLADGNVLRIDIRTAIRFDRLARSYETDDLRNLLFLERGALSIESRYDAAADEATRIDTEDATIVLPDRGLVRIDAGRRGTEVYVASGRAEVLSRRTRTVIRAGEYAYVTPQDGIDVDRWDFPRDRFTRFVEERRDLYQPDSTPNYVAADYDYDYSVSGLSDYGSWVYVSDYGQYCWRPSVASDWRPYYNGSWRWTPAGLHWISYDPWGWLPHHYGSWAFTAGFGWCWLPGSYYSPAWVYWTYTPSYVGWCPMGYYSHYNNYYRMARGWHGYEGHRSWYPHLNGRIDVTRIDRNGWNFVSSNRIGGRLDARDIIRGDRLDLRSGTTGVVSTAPLRVDNVRRGSASAAIQDAVRRAGTVPGPGTAAGGRPATERVDSNLTAILRRETSPTGSVQQDLRQSYVRTGQDPLYKPVPAETLASGQRLGSSGTSSPVVLPANPSSKPSAPLSSAPESRDVINRRGDAGSQGRPVLGGGSYGSGTTSRGTSGTGGNTGAGSTAVRDGWRDTSGQTRREISTDTGSPSVVSRDSSPQTDRREAPPLSSGSSTRIGIDESWRGGTAGGRETLGQPGTRPQSGSSSGSGTEIRTQPRDTSVTSPRSDDGWRSSGDVRISSPRTIEVRPQAPASQPSESHGSSQGGGVTLAPRDSSRGGSSGRTIESAPRREAPAPAPAPRNDTPSNPRSSDTWRDTSQGYEARAPRYDTGSSGSRVDTTRSDSGSRYTTSRSSEVYGSSSPAYEAPRREVSQPRGYDSPRSSSPSSQPSGGYSAPRSYNPPSQPSGGYSAPRSYNPPSQPSGGYSAPSSGSRGSTESRPAPQSSSGRSDSGSSPAPSRSGPKHQ